MAIATVTVWNGRQFQTLLEPEARKLADLNMVQLVDGSFTCLNARTPEQFRPADPGKSHRRKRKK